MSVCRSGSVQSVSTAGVSELTLGSSNTNTDPLLPHDENTEMETTSVGDNTLSEGSYMDISFLQLLLSISSCLLRDAFYFQQNFSILLLVI